VNQPWVPELLCPAGGLEKLKIAVDYGADAVYLGAQQYGLRAAAENFTMEQLAEGVDYAHKSGTKVFITLNSFFHDEDFDDFVGFLKKIEEIGVDAAIVSDIGVISTIRSNSNIEIHLSTQASCLNQHAARAYRDMGVTRLVLGREVSIAEAAKIKKESGIEVELFIHGSMCMAYSGQCVISNYTAGRDSNRGGCAHSCRFEYELEFEDGIKQASTFMSSKDLNGIALLNDYSKYEIDSIKIEGRMKSVHYVSTVTKSYRHSLDDLKQNGQVGQDAFSFSMTELNKLSHRDYTEASLVTPAGDDSIYDERNYDAEEAGVVGEVVEVEQNEYILIKVRSPIETNDSLEVITFEKSNVLLENLDVIDVLGNKMDRANPGRIIKLPFYPGISNRNVVRKVGVETL
jgi:putative protease